MVDVVWPIVNRLVEWAAPARLGTGFRWLLASSWTTNFGDGVTLAASPLLVASLTSDPFLISLAALLVWAPQLIFGLYAGVLSDRHNRRRIMVVANWARVVVLAALAAAIVTGHATAAIALAAVGLIATAEVFVDNASSTLTPMLVHRDDLAIANARLQTGFITLNQLIGPPIGAMLFAAGRAWPFLAQIVLVAAGVLLVARVTLPPRDRADARRQATTNDEPTGDDTELPASAHPTAARDARREIADGFRWVVHHPAVRTLSLTILIFNVTWGAAWSVLVLYAQRQLGMGPIGFGTLTTISAAGGLLGTGLYGWLTRRVSLGNIMRAGLIIETLTHLALAVTTSPWLASVIFFVFGAHAFIWGTTSVTVRQRAVPDHLRGRVGSVNTISIFGGLVIGSLIGGVLAARYGVVAPFWFAFVGSAIFVVALWRQLTAIAHDDHPDDDRPTGQPATEAMSGSVAPTQVSATEPATIA